HPVPIARELKRRIEPVAIVLDGPCPDEEGVRRDEVVASQPPGIERTAAGEGPRPWLSVLIQVAEPPVRGVHLRMPYEVRHRGRDRAGHDVTVVRVLVGEDLPT